jgi:hypothetical protein
MQVSAMSCATVGMRRAVAMMDSAAAQIASEGPVSATIAGPSPATALTSDGLLTSIPNLLIARSLLASNAFVARTAHDSYRAALDLVRPAAAHAP